jgi:hypothetical protein
MSAGVHQCRPILDRLSRRHRRAVSHAPRYSQRRSNLAEALGQRLHHNHFIGNNGRKCSSRPETRKTASSVLSVLSDYCRIRRYFAYPKDS